MLLLQHHADVHHLPTPRGSGSYPKTNTMKWFVRKYHVSGNIHPFSANGPCPPNTPDCQCMPHRSSFDVQEDDFARGIVRHLFCAKHPESFRLCVWIDGASRNNGQPGARASWGVSFGPESTYNICGCLPSEETQTSNRAEYKALRHAIDAVYGLMDAENEGVRRLMREQCRGVYFFSDSDILCKAMTMRMANWIRQGGYGFNGPVKHFELLKELHSDLSTLEDRLGKSGIYMAHINRRQNEEADALANRALDADERFHG